MSQTLMNRSKSQRTYIVTGPTSGIGRRAALLLAKQGPVVLVGRDREKLDKLKHLIERKGQSAKSVLCDLSNLASVREAAAEIIALKLPIAGLLNNAGIMQMRPTKTERGLDMSFATNHLGPFALTEALVPHLPDGAQVVFVVSAVEDPERKPARAAGFRGGRYISAEASAKGEWTPGGAKTPGYNAYATSKQALLAAAFAFARETPRLRFGAVEPGLNPTTGLGGDMGPVMRFMQSYVIPVLVRLLMPFMSFLSTPQRAARVLCKILTDPAAKTGVYYDESGRPMQGSVRVQDQDFQNRVVRETRTLLSSL